MFEWNAIIGGLAGIISAVAFIPYIRSIVKGETKPSIATWLVWTLVGGMIFASYLTAGGWTTTIWASMVYVVAPASIFFLSLKYGKRDDLKIRFVEKVCVVGALLGILVWFITESIL